MLLRNEKALVDQATVIYTIIKDILNKRKNSEVTHHNLLIDVRHNNAFILTNLCSFFDELSY